jgi:2-phospho-L-lactate guanylyltransferase
MFAVLLPVKEFERSKHRLAAWLSPAERALLARTMFEDVWATLRSSVNSGAVETLLVISNEPLVIERCRAEGVLCRLETQQRSHSESVIAGTEWAKAIGVSSLLSVPIDTPGVTAGEITSLVGLARGHSVVIVPDADGAGTNALLRTPPDSIAPQFGPGSCGLHIAQAKARRLSFTVQPVAGLAADIDTPEDAEQFLAFARSTGRASRTTSLLKQLFEAHRGVEVCS